MTNDTTQLPDQTETIVSTGSLLDELAERLQLLESKEKQLGEIHATLVVNFVDRETHGVQFTSDSECSILRLMMYVFRRLGAKIDEQAAIIDKLPKTADGVPITPGMEVCWLLWDCVSGPVIEKVRVYPVDAETALTTDGDEPGTSAIYFNEAAALAAAEAAKE